MAEQLASLQRMLADAEQLAARAEEQATQLSVPHTPLMGRMTLADGKDYPCYRLADERAPVISFTSRGMERLVWEEIQALRNHETGVEVDDEDQASPPEIIGQTVEYTLANVQSAYSSLMEAYTAQRKVRQRTDVWRAGA